MRIEVLGCSGGMSKDNYTTCLLINDNVLLDAGTGASKLTAKEMLGIKDILISHSHLDHVAGVCFITDQDIENRKEPTRIYALPETSSSFRRFVVNEVLWPEIQKVVINGVHMVEFHDLEMFKRTTVGGVDVTPFPVLHAVPTLSFCIHGEKGDFVFITDMISADQEVWDYINGLENLRYFITEAAFPNRLEEIARISKHLTPKMLVDVCKKIKKPDVEFYATHIKPLYFESVTKELEELSDVKITRLDAGMVFEI